MASRSLLLSLRRSSGVSSVSVGVGVGFGRFLSSGGAGAVNTEFVQDSEGSDDLKSRVLRLRQPKRSATNVLQRWVSEGNQISISDLRQISKDLSKSHRYKHALEISEGMVSHNEFELLDSDYAVCIVLMTKVFGINAAERYFEGLPLTAKTNETYTALLHAYAGAKLTEKMMTMYMSVGQVEKVSLVVEDLKQHKVEPDIFTYNLWISSCAATLKIDQLRQILVKMRHDPGFGEGWERYINLTNIYVSVGHLVNAESDTLVVEAEKGITQREWITYDFLIILHAGLGNKERIDQIWKSLIMTGQKMTSRNYMCILSSYLMLGQLKEVGEVIIHMMILILIYTLEMEALCYRFWQLPGPRSYRCPMFIEHVITAVENCFS
ncbi:pentatricopeptide repeat-containing protein [Pyrus ussuriensis x Pyrus communis]|uniref:Pentatricopeptide repeat-containing protein n=1 Tax=Pyrus ussuriensis x Pyrus communis TaxID=2448454 RepID=A0A5N5IKD0_9ROSA|nr:pentatricopeptide repeat-containing protein [Pyrus ussuriensis x Pyrus communis]KAB2635574.1 pentatricopeptide repeat-containing protein [Pyrus ussuriensis x Pyrus communis]